MRTRAFTLICSILAAAHLASAQTSTRYLGQGVVYQSPLGGDEIAVDPSGRTYLVQNAPSAINGVFGHYVSGMDPTGRTTIYRTFVPCGGEAAITVDATGNAYFAGTTATPELISSSAWFGPHGSEAVACIAKLDPTGAIVYTTLVGGAQVGTYALSIATDVSGAAYVTGITTANDFPTTEGAFDRSANGSNDAFLFKLDPAGTSLVYSTLIGGTGQDDGYAVAVDASGQAVVAGISWSTVFPTTPGAYQGTWAGASDGFIAKFNASGTALVYSTVVGGTGADIVRQIVLGPAGDVYGAGYTYSSNFPTTPDAEQTVHGSFASEGSDAFVLHLSGDGSALVFSTLLGGDNWELTEGLGFDAHGHAVVAGRTASSTFTVTPGAIRSIPTGLGGHDGFLTSFDEHGRIVYSTYLGLGRDVPPFAMTTDAGGDAYVTSGDQESGFLLKLVPQAALALHASASSEESPSLPASAAVDGDPWTRWSSDFSSPQWLVLDLRQRATIDRVIIHWETAYSTAYLIQVAEDGADPEDHSSWTTIYGTTTGDGGIDDVKGLGATGRYLRLVGQQRATPWGHSVWEFVAFGTALAPPNQPPEVTLTAPAEGAHFPPGTVITASATATDPDGTVTHVAFFVNGALQVDDADAPFGASITLATGFYTIAAIAYDNAGLSSQPALVRIYVDLPAAQNLATGRPAFASSVENGLYPASNAVDGDLSTRWSSAFSDPQWLVVDLGGPTHVESVRLWWESAYATAFDIQVSDDGTTWTTIYAATNGTGGTQSILGLNGNGRYVRILGKERATPWGYSLWELGVFGTPLDSATTNVAKGRPATASSTEDAAFPASFATDGDATTRWSSAFADPQWLMVDLGGFFDLTRVVLRWERAFALTYDVQVSNDTQTWRSVRFIEESDGGDDDWVFRATTARYIRVYAWRRATEWGVSLWELEAYGVPSALTTNLSLHAASVIASSTERTDTPATAAIDGKVDTRWSSSFSDAEWLVVDLGQVYDVRRVVVRWEAAYARRYEIQVSMDGVNWSTAVGIGAGDGGDDDLVIVWPEARYVRMNGLERATPYGYSLWELEVYATVD